ncbi:MAG: hypothetical protein A3G43_01710 [Ignavibacteria bacterium RIFCSPLOWO2_12_FULL_56_21]|nr:MAG: hypothetical protein A3G43_01710 [Ignavibacteria bacterium RIFCSPLOWO2_12_FULL_56_21]
MHILEFLVLKILQAVLCRLPLSTVRSAGRIAGGFVFKGLGFRRRITMENLRRAFPEKPEAELRSIAAQAFGSVGTTFFEFVWFPKWKREAIAGDIDVQHAEVLRDALSQGKGLIVLTAHYGSWEVFGQAICIVLDMPGTLLVKVQSNPLVDAEVDKWRRKFGNVTVPTTSIREILRSLQGGGWVALAGDQSAPKESMAVTFFGRTVSTFQGPAVFALRTGAPLVLGMLHRNVNDRYTLSVERIPHDDLDGSSEANIRTLTERHVRATERVIRAHPEQWMWMHKRWKHIAETADMGNSE